MYYFLVKIILSAFLRSYDRQFKRKTDVVETVCKQRAARLLHVVDRNGNLKFNVTALFSRLRRDSRATSVRLRVFYFDIAVRIVRNARRKRCANVNVFAKRVFYFNFNNERIGNLIKVKVFKGNFARISRAMVIIGGKYAVVVRTAAKSDLVVRATRFLPRTRYGCGNVLRVKRKRVGRGIFHVRRREDTKYHQAKGKHHCRQGCQNSKFASSCSFHKNTPYIFLTNFI